MDKDKAKWKDRFESERLARIYDEVINIFSLRRIERQKVLKAILPVLSHSSCRILEIGAGTGVVTELLMKKYPHALMTAVDGAASMLDRAKIKKYFMENENRVEWIQAEYSKPSWLAEIEKPFNLVVAFDALHHLSHQRKRELCDEIYSILKSDGYLIISDHIVSDRKYSEEPQYGLWMEEILKNLRSLEEGSDMVKIIEKSFSWTYHDIQNLSVSELEKIFTERLKGEGENPIPLMQYIDILNEIGFKEVTAEYRYSNFAIISGRR